jgi:hypothetical protein
MIGLYMDKKDNLISLTANRIFNDVPNIEVIINPYRKTSIP